MSFPHCDVAIVGAGAAGLTAAIGLARAGFRVAVVEAAAFPGAENWSGCVYFAENLAHANIIGPEGVESLAWERRLVERGFFATDGHGLLGMKYRDPAAFPHCYTVLRPIYDHHLSQFALRHGAQVLTNTTAESLIRENGRVIGVCTNRGALYAKLTFLAEGDASHLVTREGYERSKDPRDKPKFLQGIKQVLELPPRAIEQRFGVDAEQGVAYEMLVRNGTLRGKSVRLNMGGFLYTNRQSLSVGLVLPADNLHENFDGDPNLLMEWFLQLPSLQPWLEGAKQGPFGAKIIRGGGAKEVPTLIDDGLAIGGAASGIGIDFPYPNFTGPATGMGLLLAQAARKIRDEGGAFSRDELDRHYLKPLRETHYWKDVEFLRYWPGYVKKTSFFFGPNVDLALGSAYLWTRPGKGLAGRWDDWLHLVRDLTSGDQRAEVESDLHHFRDALRIQEVAKPPSPWRLLLDGTLNTVRDLVGQPRALPPHGDVTLHYSVAGGAEPSGLPPAQLRYWFERYAPAIAAAARVVYHNDATPLATKLPTATRLLSQHVSLPDFARALSLGVMAGTRWLFGSKNGKSNGTPSEEADRYFQAAKAATDLTPATANATRAWEARLAQLGYDTVKSSHIHVLWPQSIAAKNAVAQAGLWHVCPAHVYEARVNAAGQVQVVVNFENCIKCETCWRTSDIVDWGRDGAHRFVYAVHSPVVGKLLADMGTVGSGQWAVGSEEVVDGGQWIVDSEEIAARLERKLEEFDEALAGEPRTVDTDRAEHLEMLARYAHQLALLLQARSASDGSASRTLQDSSDSALRLQQEILAITQRRLEHVTAGRYSWAASDGRQLRFHHLTKLRGRAGMTHLANGDRKASLSKDAEEVQGRLNSLLQPNLWRELEQQKPLPAEQNVGLLELLVTVPRIESQRRAETLHPPRRRLLLADLGRRDPSLAYRAASHLWARDLATLAGGEVERQLAKSQASGSWVCTAVLDQRGEAIMVPAREAQAALLINGSRFQWTSTAAGGLTVEPCPTLGLRGAGFVRWRLDAQFKPEAEQTIDGEAALFGWQVITSKDLIAIAVGLADYLCKRAIDHAASRVQFPGLFQDEQARDSLGKFGSIKKMIAEMAAGKRIIDMLDSLLSKGESVEETFGRAHLFKAVTAEILGSAPGSIAYNAGQVFGGTGYSEDDTLSKLYRDSAAFRFLGVPNSEVYLRHGISVLENWTADGQKVSRLPWEKELFQLIAQRQALCKEMGMVRYHADRLIECINAWKFTSGNLPSPEAQTAFAEAVGRQDALLYVSEKFLDITQSHLEFGVNVEAGIPLLRTWLNKARVEFDDFLTVVSTLREGSTPVATPVGTPVAYAPGSPVTQYAAFLKTDLPYASGDFLGKATDPGQARYVPEMIETDEFLCKRNKEIIELVNHQFGQPRNGMVYERYLEEQHRPDAADLDFLREHGFFRVPIPKELGGEGRSKADYYLLTVNTHRLADAAISLTIQVNSSLGTTPVLLARDKDLPKAIKGATDPKIREELERRREASDLFCRWVASGQISAFALTEPSAGSDTARVGTRAKLRQVVVEAEADNVYRFTPVGAKETRRLLDARRVVFVAKPQAAEGETEARYRFSDTAGPAAIQFDEYDYETDSCKKRYFVVGSRKVYFDDVAQVRERDGKQWYDYWELTGAKMWITNGRVMGIMALYAKTEQGVTGFMIDRHAEGLIVGKDEAKMGQNGSPTNELALQSVRVPRENVIGLEGRGQVNALETLNVGRAGLAMSAMCQMVRLCDWSREFAKSRYGEIPAWIGGRLKRLEEERFIAEAMSYEIIGRFEHKQTKSIRMESAIAKMLVSELFHHSIELAEDIHGLAGQTQAHLVEKRKRDARVLNIYEGTNEIQRFLILKELTELAATWRADGKTGAVSRRVGEEETRQLAPAARLDGQKARLRQLAGEAVGFFGQQLWQNPNLQANCFVLSESAAWIAAAESTLGRLTWLARTEDANPEVLATGRRALTRCFGEVTTRLDRFARDLVDLRGGHYAAEVRAASLLLQQEEAPTAAAPQSVITRPLSILVVLDAPVPGAPQPRTQDGKLLEPYCVLTDGDKAALETALRLRDAGPVRIEVVSAAPASSAVILRETLSLGVDRVRLIFTPGAVPADRAAAALAKMLKGESGFDLVLGGAGTTDAQEGLVAQFTAQELGIPMVGTAAQVGVQTQDNTLRLIDNEGHARLRSLPASLRIEPSVTLREFTMEGWLKGLAQKVETIPWPAGVAVSTLEFEEMASGAADSSGEQPPRPLLPREASSLVMETAGIEAGATHAPSADGQPRPSMPAIAEVDSPWFAAKNGGQFIVAVLATDADGKLRPTARKTLDAAQFLTPYLSGTEKVVLLVAPRGDEIQQRALAELTALTPFDICMLAVDGAESSDEVRCRLLAECWSNSQNSAAAVVGEPWCEAAFAALAAASGQMDTIAVRVKVLDRQQGGLVAEGSIAKGKLRTRQTLAAAAGRTLWIALAAEADIGTASLPERRPLRRLERWTPKLDRFLAKADIQRLLQELKQDLGMVRLADAEFIIDVGFGVGNRDGYEAVIDPLEAELRQLGVRGLTIGGSRKVTEELHLLPADRQIGQSGVSVNPRVLLAIGVSGAPQHLNYIGPRATVLAFNRDAEAPLLTLNQRQARPKVYPVIGDLFETVPAFIACLREERNA